MKRPSLLILAAALALPVAALAYPNGTPLYVTDAAPFCAACHSAALAAYMPELPPAAAAGETIEGKHFGSVRAQMPGSPYAELTAAQREKIIAEATAIDAHSAVDIAAPGSAACDQQITVVVKARGGNGPAIGVMLLDQPLRFQARPVSSEGWQIVGEPQVLGQSMKPYSAWTDARIAGLKRNVSFVLVRDQSYDPAAQLYPGAQVTWTLRAPATPGTYTLTAALLYGTENAQTAGAMARPSGRILFSKRVDVVVK